MSAKKSDKKKQSEKRTRDHPLSGIVRAIDSAGRDADLARRNAADPKFRQQVQADRRGTLSKFQTVRDALADRERIEKNKKKS